MAGGWSHLGKSSLKCMTVNAAISYNLSWSCHMEYLHVAFLVTWAFFTAWQLHNSKTSYMAAPESKCKCPKTQGGD